MELNLFSHRILSTQFVGYSKYSFMLWYMKIVYGPMNVAKNYFKSYVAPSMSYWYLFNKFLFCQSQNGQKVLEQQELARSVRGLEKWLGIVRYC